MVLVLLMLKPSLKAEHFGRLSRAECFAALRIQPSQGADGEKVNSHKMQPDGLVKQYFVLDVVLGCACLWGCLKERSSRQSAGKGVAYLLDVTSMACVRISRTLVGESDVSQPKQFLLSSFTVHLCSHTPPSRLKP